MEHKSELLSQSQTKGFLSGNSFTGDEIETIISFVRNHPDLYDPGRIGYTSRVITTELWQELANLLGKEGM